MKYLLILCLSLVACAKPKSPSTATQEVEVIEEQYVLPIRFYGTLNFKELRVGVQNQWAWCEPVGCQLGGIGKDTEVVYNSQICYFNTTLVKNYRTNYYYLTLSPRVEDIPNFNYQPQSSECNELLGSFWVHHNGQDKENIYLHITLEEIPFNAEFSRP